MAGEHMKIRFYEASSSSIPIMQNRLITTHLMVHTLAAGGMQAAAEWDAAAIESLSTIVDSNMQRCIRSSTRVIARSKQGVASPEPHCSTYMI
jgi:hypothetical protein